jgi:hypothetical protein
MMRDWAKTEAGRYPTELRQNLADVSFVRFVTPDAWSAVMKQCSDAAGARGITFVDGVAALTESVTDAERQTDSWAYAACSIEYPLVSVRSQLRTPQQLDYIYAYYRNSLVPCLRTSGVGVAGMPAPDQFRDGSDNGLTMWMPYDHLSSAPWLTAASLVSLREKCPPAPPGLPNAVTPAG